MAVSTIDTEALRKKCGLTRLQWAELVKDETDGLRVLRRFEKFLDYTRKSIELEFENPDFTVDGVPYLSTIQVARAVGIGEFHVANLRWREKLKGLPHGRRTIYSREDLMDFIQAQPDGERHAAVAKAFVRWNTLQDR